MRQSTGELVTPPTVALSDTERDVMMPRRRQTREQNRRDRITAEQEHQHQAWLAATYQPPPF